MGLDHKQAKQNTSPRARQVLLTEDMAQRLNVQRAVEGRILDCCSLKRAMEDPASGVPAEDDILLRIVGGDGLRGLRKVIDDGHAWVVAGADGGLLCKTLGPVAASHDDRGCSGL